MYNICLHTLNHSMNRGYLRSVMVKALDCRIVVSEFEFHSRYYVHFRTNTVGKGMNPFILAAMGLNCTTTALLGGWLWF